jgi:polyhydroxyalkanoate synthesis regulator protein
VANPMVTMPGFEIMKEQQEAFIKAMTGGLAGSPAPGTGPGKNDSADNLDDIKLQLTALQEKLSKM